MVTGVAFVLLFGLVQAHICDIPGICPEGYTCVPDTPYSGNCVRPEVCTEDTCPEGEICVENDDRTHTCMCPPGSSRHDGNCTEFCDIPDACLDPKMECVPTNSSYDCNCPGGHLVRDDKCVPACMTSPCPADMDCLLEQNNTFSCLCKEGEVVADNEEECVHACQETSCPEHMECVGEEFSYKCLCPAGFRFTEDEVCVPECEVEPCSEGESCVSHEGVYQCCPVGHLPHPDTRDCTPVCEIPDICEDGMECLVHNINGSFSCLCPDHSAFNAAGKCVEFCELEVCHPGMECTSDKNGYNCTCTADTSVDCKRCTDNPCHPDFVCVQHEFTHECVCDEGYRLEKGRCVDVDECEEKDVCGVYGARCTNTYGSYKCSCARNTYYNDSSNSCDRYDMCPADPCDTAHTGMSCKDLAQGFACACPPDYPEEMCARKDPCSCKENEECVGRDGQYSCECDKFSLLAISNSKQECASDKDIKDAAFINPKAGVTFAFRLGETDKISLKLKDAIKDKRVPWHRVAWFKLDRGMTITEGRRTTPTGHFRTPQYRQQVAIKNIRPEDAGTYQVRVEKEGYRPVTENVKVEITEPLTADYGPRDSGQDKWKFKVQVKAKFADFTITWYRRVAGHRELLVDDGETSRYTAAGRQIRVGRVPGKYIAKLRGTLPGPSGTVITSEVEFDATQ